MPLLLFFQLTLHALFEPVFHPLTLTLNSRFQLSYPSISFANHELSLLLKPLQLSLQCLYPLLSHSFDSVELTLLLSSESLFSSKVTLEVSGTLGQLSVCLSDTCILLL